MHDRINKKWEQTFNQAQTGIPENNTQVKAEPSELIIDEKEATG
jgi:hypothetical protein